MTRGHYKSLAERRLAQIKHLQKELKAEKRLTNALSRLEFHPKQNPARLKEVKKATTIKRKVTEERRAA